MARFCENCGAPLPDGAAFCAECGTPAPKQAPQQPASPALNRCAKCGAPLSPGEAFCAECGTPAGQQPTPAAPQPPAQKLCAKCGAPLAPDEAFCAECGTPVGQQPAPAAPQPSQTPYAQPQGGQYSYGQPYPQQPPYAPAAPQKKQGKGLLIGLISGGAALLIALVLVGGFVWPGFFKSAKPTENPSAGTQATKPAAPKPAKPTEPAETKPQKPTETTEPTEPENPFTDMTEDDYSYENFIWAYKNGIVSGGEANLTKELTRGEAVTFLWRSQGSPEPVGTVVPFTDLEEERYYYRPAIWAYEQGIVSASDEFKPDDELTTAQAITFISRMVGGGDCSGRQYFADVPEEKYYFAPVGWAVENGILERYDWFFDPEAVTWREEFIVWLSRAMGADVEEAWYEEPVPESLSEKGVEVNLTEAAPVLFHSARSQEDFTETNLLATVVSYDVFTEADGYPTPAEGYEYRRLQLRIDGVDDTANHGNHHYYLFTDYYTPDLLNYTAVLGEDGVYTATVYYNGEFRTITYWQSCEKRPTSGNMKDAIYAYTVLATVPKGYDGLVFCLESTQAGENTFIAGYQEYGPDYHVIFRFD